MAAPTPQRRVTIFLALSLLLHAGAVWFAHSWRGQQRSLYVIYRPSQPDQLLAFSRRQYLQPKVIDLNRIVTDTQLMLNRLIGEHIVQQTALNAEVGWVRVDPGQIEQILFNLEINARDAMPHGGRLVVETTNIELVEADGDIPPGTYVMLRISDTGVGMDD